MKNPTAPPKTRATRAVMIVNTIYLYNMYLLIFSPAYATTA